MFPSSVAVIPDGNRRFAKQNFLPLGIAYAKGFDKVDQVAKWMADSPVKATTFWALSLENLTKRSQGELKILFRIMDSYLERALKSREFEEKGVKVSFFGKKRILPENTVSLMKKLEEKTCDYLDKELNFAVAYSGEEELANASVRLAKDIAAKKVREEDAEGKFSQYLYYSKPVDLVIRTGGVQRLSGFLPFQVAYSELYFSEKLWPAFEKKDFDQALDYFAATERRFGR